MFTFNSKSNLKFLILGLGYISISKALPFNNGNQQTQQDCQTLLEIYQYFNLNLPPFAYEENQNCCDMHARIAASNGNYPTTDWICDSSNTRINTIILKERNISTDIPWDLFKKLDNLEVLHLYDNQLQGEIRGDLRDIFPNLKQLRLQNNNLSGYLPTYLPPNIETIIFSGNNQINDSIPNEWSSLNSIRDCILPNNICTPRNSSMQCFSSSNKSNEVATCQNDAQEDRSAALQQLNNTNINNNDNNMNNNNNNNNYLNNGNDNTFQQSNDISNSNGINNNNSKKGKRSYAVLIMTACIICLLIFILIFVCFISHFSRKKTREKEKDIYKGTTLFEENLNSRTEASIFYSKTNTNNTNVVTFDDNNNSISIFNCMNHRNSINSQTTVEHKLLNNNSPAPPSPVSPVTPVSPEEISFIENPHPNNMNQGEMSFSVIDPSAEIIEPQPAFIPSPNSSIL